MSTLKAHYIFTYQPFFSLTIHVFHPLPKNDSFEKPVVIFFHGGGWKQGSPLQFYPLCADLANNGIVAISATYRLITTHKITPFEALTDAKTAILWIKQSSNLLNINPKHLIIGGASVGGQLALMAALSEEIRPHALILFNPILDASPIGFGYELLGNAWQTLSPLHNLNNQLPSLLAFFGSNDRHIPLVTIQRFKDQLQQLNISHNIFIYNNQPHGFFNYNDGRNPFYHETLKETLSFLDKLGFLNYD